MKKKIEWKQSGETRMEVNTNYEYYCSKVKYYRFFIIINKSGQYELRF